MRIAFISALAAVVLSFGGCVASTSTEAEAAALKAAKSWLALIDAEAYEASWDASATYFHGAVTKDHWVQTLTASRKPLGANISRKVKSSSYHTSLEGAPQGQYVVIRFISEFANRRKVYETVTQMKDKDGAWRVAGYDLKTGSSNWLQDLMDR